MIKDHNVQSKLLNFYRKTLVNIEISNYFCIGFQLPRK
jgi:hypothetical protein